MSVNVDDIMRKTKSYWYEDGLVEILAGLTATQKAAPPLPSGNYDVQLFPWQGMLLLTREICIRSVGQLPITAVASLRRALFGCESPFPCVKGTIKRHRWREQRLA